MDGRYQESAKVTALARQVTPGGVQTLSKRPERFPEGAYPTHLYSGQGARVWDVDGNEYVDLICGLGALPLGHGHERVSGAAWEQGYRMVLSSLGHPLEIEVAEALCKVIPNAEQVRFVKTGSEACAAAIRIARRWTGREHVVVVGYHGWHDWVMVTAPEHDGVPEVLSTLVTRIPYNDTAALEQVMRREKVAAVILEPTLLTPPAPDYLDTVVTLCTLHGAVSIFDEMVCGFRWATAGGQGYFDVIPDLAVYGKGLANGFPLACVVGPKRMMAYADVISGTFGGECVSLAAAKAVLREYASGEPIDRQWWYGNAILSHCRQHGIPYTGYPVHPKITYTGEDMAVFLQETARRGLLIHPAGFNIPAVMTGADLQVVRDALTGAKRALEEGVKLEGKMPVEGVFR